MLIKEKLEIKLSAKLTKNKVWGYMQPTQAQSCENLAFNGLIISIMILSL